MGASNGGIAIKTDTSKIDLLTVVKDLFGKDFEKSDSSCDSRKSDCVYAGKTKDFLVIVNTGFADKFFRNHNTDLIRKYLEYFSNPEFVFAFEEYDSGGTYSYSLIYNGVVKRQFKSLSYETTIDFGEPEPIELKWKNAETTTEDLGDGEFETLYKHPEKDFSCPKGQLPQVILQELMLEKLGFISWNMHDFIIEQAHFKKGMSQKNENGHAVTTEDSTPIEHKKPWWKIW
ncbi:MAG: hypothetical protein WCF67_04700 [Chitinophagaceae bacterium]